MADTFDVIIIGAGASGLMCAARAGSPGKKVLVLDHNKAPGKKILMSGGGRCNFTNREVNADHYICANPHFCKSALSRYTPEDFLDLTASYGIDYEEREFGRLFCTGSASEILDMLLEECRKAGVKLALGREIKAIDGEAGFRVQTDREVFQAESLVIATGGVSIPGAGASPLGYRVAEQFGIDVVSPQPGLVPFTLQPDDKKTLAPLAGIAVDAGVSIGKTDFRENLLFTHRGMSGPVILQISSFWQPGDTITIDLLPWANLAEFLTEKQAAHPKKQIQSILGKKLPKRLVTVRLPASLSGRPLSSLSPAQLRQVARAFQKWEIKPGGTEGYRTAEVTKGGVDCRCISSKTMEARDMPGLFFIGEVLDVTGQLGGYNLHWAWASGWCAGRHV